MEPQATHSTEFLGLRAETPDQVEPALVEALKYNGPALIEIPVSAGSSRCRRRSLLNTQPYPQLPAMCDLVRRI